VYECNVLKTDNANADYTLTKPPIYFTRCTMYRKHIYLRSYLEV